MKRITALFLLLIVLLSGCKAPSRPHGNESSALPDVQSPPSDFEYTTYSDYAEVTGYTGKSDTVSIPDSFNGKPVTVIGNGAFKNADIVSAVIPDSVKTISDFAFNGCKRLERITLGASVKEIKSYAFVNCVSLKKIDLSSPTLTIIGEGAFAYCEKLTEVVFGNNITEIGSTAFTNCESLAKAELPKNLKAIGDNAFAECLSLESVTIPKTLEKWGMTPFSRTLSLTSITFESGLTQIGGIFGAFSECAAESLTVPRSVTSVSANAFSDFKNLKSITFYGNAPSFPGNLPFGEPKSSLTVYYFPSTMGWDETPIKNVYTLIALKQPTEN